MTIVNKKSNPVPFNKSIHYTAIDKVAIGKGTVCGQVARSDAAYLLRRKDNPHTAEWCVFPAKSEPKDS